MPFSVLAAGQQHISKLLIIILNSFQLPSREQLIREKVLAKLLATKLAFIRMQELLFQAYTRAQQWIKQTGLLCKESTLRRWMKWGGWGANWNLAINECSAALPKDPLGRMNKSKANTITRVLILECEKNSRTSGTATHSSNFPPSGRSKFVTKWSPLFILSSGKCFAE